MIYELSAGAACLFPPHAAPTGSPEGLSSTSVESRSLIVEWGPAHCENQGGPITGYKLHYNNSNGTSTASITGEENRNHTLTGLAPYTRYSLQVAAVNDGGTGPYSEPAITVDTGKRYAYSTVQ